MIKCFSISIFTFIHSTTLLLSRVFKLQIIKFFQQNTLHKSQHREGIHFLHMKEKNYIDCNTLHKDAHVYIYHIKSKELLTRAPEKIEHPPRECIRSEQDKTRVPRTDKSSEPRPGYYPRWQPEMLCHLIHIFCQFQREI